MDIDEIASSTLQLFNTDDLVRTALLIHDYYKNPEYHRKEKALQIELVYMSTQWTPI